MVLAAGEGTRMQPLTFETPKSLLLVGGVPVIVHILNWLRKHGINEVAINLWYLGDKIEQYLGDGSRFGTHITYSHEDTIMGTAGGVKKMDNYFDGTFVVVCGDVLTNFDLNAMVGFHHSKGALATIALSEVDNPWEVGIAEVDKNYRIKRFVEKPPRGSETSSLGSGGIYVFETGIFKYIPGDRFYDFAYDVFPVLLKSGLPVFGYIIRPEDYLIDIGTIEKYRRADGDVAAGKVVLS